MPYTVFFTDDAAADLEEIYDYIELNDVPGKADYVLDKIEKICSDLAQQPKRGRHPKELRELGIREYREIRFKPYRLIYRVVAKKVYILLVADGRRDMNSLLQRRLL